MLYFRSIGIITSLVCLKMYSIALFYTSLDLFFISGVRPCNFILIFLFFNLIFFFLVNVWCLLSFYGSLFYSVEFDLVFFLHLWFFCIYALFIYSYLMAEVSWKPADNANWFAFVVRGMTKSAQGRGRLESASSCKNKSQRKGFDKESGV